MCRVCDWRGCNASALPPSSLYDPQPLTSCPRRRPILRLADGRAAEAALRALSEAGAGAALRELPLLRHNACVFRSGEAALQVGGAAGRRPPAQRFLVSHRLGPHSPLTPVLLDANRVSAASERGAEPRLLLSAGPLGVPHTYPGRVPWKAPA